MTSLPSCDAQAWRTAPRDPDKDDFGLRPCAGFKATAHEEG